MNVVTLLICAVFLTFLIDELLYILSKVIAP
jgi:hypothetical protein